MKKEYFPTVIFFAIVAAFFYLFYKIMVPFFTPIAWAAIFAIVFFPMYLWFTRKIKSPGIAAMISTIIVFLIIIGPSSYILASLVSEAANLLDKINTQYETGGFDSLLSFNIPFLDMLKTKLAAYPQLASLDFQSIVKDIVTTITKTIGTQATSLIANVTKTLFEFILILFSLFFFFRDGDKVIAFLKRLTPLESDKVNVIYAHLKELIEGMMYGGVVIALLQGFLGGLLFVIMGLSSPILWGAVMAFLAFLPILGPFLIYIPAGIILIAGGSPIKGVLMIVIGTLLVSQIDNFLRPMLFSGKTQTHTLMLFFSIMGGAVMFGLLGVVLGPIIAAIFLSILKMLELQLHPDTEEIGADKSVSE